MRCKQGSAQPMVPVACHLQTFARCAESLHHPPCTMHHAGNDGQSTQPRPEARVLRQQLYLRCRRLLRRCWRAPVQQSDARDGAVAQGKSVRVSSGTSFPLLSSPLPHLSLHLNCSSVHSVHAVRVKSTSAPVQSTLVTCRSCSTRHFLVPPRPRHHLYPAACLLHLPLQHPARRSGVFCLPPLPPHSFYNHKDGHTTVATLEKRVLIGAGLSRRGSIKLQ